MADIYREKLEEHISLHEESSLKIERVLDILDETRPFFFNGHFSHLGKVNFFKQYHTDVFLRMDILMSYAWLYNELINEVISWLSQKQIEFDIVIGDGGNGMIHAYDIARHFNPIYKCRTVYTRENLETGYPSGSILEGIIKKKEKALIIVSVAENGYEIRPLLELAKAYKAEIVQVCALFEARENTDLVKKIKKEYSYYSLVQYQREYYFKRKCPLCRDRVPFVSYIDLASRALAKPINEILAPLKDRLIL